MIRTIGLVVAILAPCCPYGAQGDLATLYKKALPELRKSAIPVLLPRELPSDHAPVKSVAVLQADKKGYFVGFSQVSNCRGALSCSFLHVGTYLANSNGGHDYKKGLRIRLSDGTIGYFQSRDCSGTHCTEAVLTFGRGPYVYEIDEKLGPYVYARGPKAGMNVDVPILKKLYSELRSQ
jgi:hypothetical protein